MAEKLLTFELMSSCEELDVHTNEEGLRYLIETLQRLLSTTTEQAHDHLMTPKWGGAELSEEKQGADSRLINHVKVMLWRQHENYGR